MAQVRRAFGDPSGSGGGTLQYGSVIATSAYDGMGRRITKVVSHSGDLDMTYHFYYEGQSIIEIRNGSELVLKQHVWANLAGGYVDELIENDVNADPADGSEQDCEIRGWACQDANYNVIGFVDDDLAVLERYEYTPYGQRVVFYSAGSNDPLAHTPTLIPRRVELSGTSGGYGAYAIGHQGLYHDEETASGSGAGATLVYNRARMLHTKLGRFTQRDPLGYVDGMSAYGAYHIMHGALDPLGLRTETAKGSDTCHINIYKTIYFIWYPFVGEKWVATISYPCDDWCEEALAQEMARKLNINADIGTLKDVLDDVADAAEIGIRLANEPLDLLLSGGEFLENPGLLTGLALLPSVPGGAKKLAPSSGVRFAQRGVSSTFRHGEFAGRSIDDVAAGLRNGTIRPDQLPIQTVTRNGVQYTVNNRSLMALRRAGMEPTVIKDVTGNALFEKQITQRLSEMGGSVADDFAPVIRGGGQ